MKFLALFIFTTLALNSYAKTVLLPQYPSATIIPAGPEKDLYFEAINEELKSQGLLLCKQDPKWILVDGMLIKHSGTVLFKFQGNSPLYILRFIRLKHKIVYISDFKIYTNEAMTSITYVGRIDYTVVTKRTNIGNLEKPFFENREFATIINSNSCF